MQSITVKLGDKIVKHHPINSNSLTIGRARDNEIMIENLSVSRNHARILKENGKFLVVDLNSANGMFVNGVRVTRAELTDGDIISIGKHRLHFSDPSAPRTGAPVVLPPEPISSDKVEKIPVSTSPTGTVMVDDVDPEPELVPDSATTALLGQLRKGKRAAVLVVTNGKQQGEVFALQEKENVIGRHTADVRLYDMGAGKRHATLTISDKGIVLKDLGSWQGTTVNGEKVRQHMLKPGDVIVVGGTTLEFNVSASNKAPAPPPTAQYFERLNELAHASVNVDESADSGVVMRIQADRLTSGEFDLPDMESAHGDDDDEFAPMTDEELEALEREDELALEGTPAESASDTWRKLESSRGTGVLQGAEADLRRIEEASFRAPDAHALAEDPNLAGDDDVGEMDHQEERSLFRGPVQDAEPVEQELASPTGGLVGDETPLAVADFRGDKHIDNIEVPEGVDPKEVRRWSRGLKNRSKVVRREAARKLKELTGIDYDWESEPR